MSPASFNPSVARAQLHRADEHRTTAHVAEWISAAVRQRRVGGQVFFTESHLEGTSDRAAFASTTNHASFAAAWSVGGGVYMPVYAGKTKVQLDLGLQYLNGGRTRYLAPGSITDLPGAQIAVTPLESATHLVVVRLGARIGL